MSCSNFLKTFDLRAKAKKLAALFFQIQPNPQCELDYTSAYTLLVAVVLSAQSTDRRVNQVTKGLFEKAATPFEMVEMPLKELEDFLKTLGLYRQKARHILGLSQKLIDRYHGIVPGERSALESLPGVGRKSANVVLATCFGQDVLAVDTHVFRVSRRLGLASGTTPLAVEKELMSVLPSEWIRFFHHWLVLHGRYICKAQKPLCAVCPVKTLCPSRL